MIDLGELERRLDKALAQETSESLTEWLMTQRNPSLKNFLGKGSVEPMTACPHRFNNQKIVSKQYNYPHKKKGPGENKFNLAA